MVKGFLLEMQEWFNTHTSIHGLMSDRKERMNRYMRLRAPAGDV